MSSTIIYTRTIACLVFSEMKGKKRKSPVETKHLRRLIRSRIQKKFNMYDRIYGRPENVYIDCKDPDRKVRKTKNNYVGLLLPLTGEKRSAGSLVLNTFRYSLANKPMDIIFKIYDTKGTVEGAINAALKGKKDKVETFIGPIFSYETKALKRRFSNDNSMVFFSLSPDLSNISDNIIVSGQNPKDQISCIISDLKFKDIKDLLLIHHKDRYGEIIKESVQENLRTLTLKSINISFLELDNKKDLNREIKSISHFEKRKNILKAKINQISDDQTIPKNEKKRDEQKR